MIARKTNLYSLVTLLEQNKKDGSLQRQPLFIHTEVSLHKRTKKQSADKFLIKFIERQTNQIDTKFRTPV